MENQINIDDQNIQQVGQNPVSQSVQIPEKSKVNYWVVLAGILLILFLGISWFYLTSFKKSTEETISTSVLPTVLPTDILTGSPVVSESSWKTFENENPFYKFSISAPPDATVYLGDQEGPPIEFLTESANEVTLSNEPWIVGVFLKGYEYPYGLVINYTTLGETDEKIVLGEELRRAVSSDIDFGVKNAVMSKGKSTRTVRHVSKGISDKVETKTFLYTKYIFRNNDQLYVVNIQTDENLTNYPILKNILQSWKFEKEVTTDSTNNWKNYEGVTAYSVNGNTKFSLKYPSSWALERMEGGVGKGNLLFPMGDINADIINYKAPYILLGMGGHGGGCEEQSRVFTAGEAKYCWGEFGGMARFNKNNTDYILRAFYYGNPQSLTNEQYKNIFDQILNTFKFLD